MAHLLVNQDADELLLGPFSATVVHLHGDLAPFGGHEVDVLMARMTGAWPPVL